MNVVHELNPSACREVLLDSARLAAVAETELLNEAANNTLNRLTYLASEILDVPLTIISFVGEKEHYFKSFHGLPEPWSSNPIIPIDNSVCQYTLVGDILSIEDVREHPLLANNPAVPALNLVAYLGVPLVTPDGHNLGAFCAIDYQRRKWSEKNIRTLRELTSSVMSEIHLQLSLERLRKAQDEREKVFAMIAHDLRSPISTVYSFAELLSESLDDKEFCKEAAITIARLSKKSIEIMENYLDRKLASLSAQEIGPRSVDSLDLIPLIENIVSDLKCIHGDVFQFVRDRPRVDVSINPHAFSRALENLAANAVKYGEVSRKVTIRVRMENPDEVWIDVHNFGVPIAAEELNIIFQYNQRTASAKNSGKKGWGLGLELVHKVTASHKGKVEVESTFDAGTTFRMKFPAQSSL